MRRPLAYGDEIVIAAAAMKFSIQIAVFKDGSCQEFSHGAHTHTIFLLCADDHYQWCHAASPICYACDSRPGSGSLLSVSLPAFVLLRPSNAPPFHPVAEVSDAAAIESNLSDRQPLALDHQYQ